MKKQEENKKIETVLKEDGTPSMRTFSSQEEAELFNIMEVLKKSDMEKFRLFCRMMRIGHMLSPNKVIK